ncbi:MAG TPA: hypothetical protein VIL00_12470 [Pseudonocardiaceae bacterium]|mgnify:CR=1 FL=1
MTTVTTPPSATWRRVLARLATEVLAPWVWVLLLPLAVAWQATGYALLPALGWGLWIALTGSIVPMLVIVRGARRGRWDGHHVRNREGRLVPLLACFASLGVGAAVAWVLHAPSRMLVLAAAMLATLVACGYLTVVHRWKVSVHAAVAAGGLVILVVCYGPVMALLAPAVVWVCWSRVELQDHTAAQVWVGALVGVLVGGGVFAVPALL